MTAIMRRELSAYFNSPIGYIFLSVFYVFAGFYFFMSCLAYNSTDLSPVFQSMFTIVLFVLPILTMRLLSEDKKYRTDQALLTAPVSLTGIVLGKFFAAVTVFLISLSVTLLYGVIIAVYAPPNWPQIIGNFAALLLIGMAFISIGLFISAMTENQVVAAIGAFAAALILIMIDAVGNVITLPWLKKIIVGISFFNRYNSFNVGKFDLGNVVFFLSVSAIFVFLTVRVLEKRRWS